MTDYDLWLSTSGPATTTADASVNLGTQFHVASAAWLKGYKVWRPADAGMTGPILTRTYEVTAGGGAGPVLAGGDASITLSGTGWQTVLLAAPVALTVGQAYMADALFPSGYAATGGYWASGGPGAGGITHGPLVAPDAATAPGGIQGGYDYSAGYAFPANTFNGGGYWVSPIVSDVDPAGGTTVDASATLAAGSSLTAGAVVERPATATLAADSSLLVNAAGQPVAVLAAEAHLAAATTFSAYADVAVPAAADLAADSTLTAAATATVPGTATLAATSSLTASGTSTDRAAAILAADSTLTAVATVPGQERDLNFSVGPPLARWSAGPPSRSTSPPLVVSAPTSRWTCGPGRH